MKRCEKCSEDRSGNDNYCQICGSILEEITEQTKIRENMNFSKETQDATSKVLTCTECKEKTYNEELDADQIITESETVISNNISILKDPPELHGITDDREFNEINRPLVIYWETTKYHLALLISLFCFIMFYSKPWIKFDSLTALTTGIASDVLEEISGIWMFKNIIIGIPILLAAIASVSVVTMRKVKVFTIVTGVVMIIYWIFLFCIYSLGKIGERIGINYSTTVSFKLFLISSVVILIIGVILPEIKIKESKGYIVIKKELDRNFYNIGVRIANVVLLLLLFTPFIKYNPVLIKNAGKVSAINNFLMDKVNFNLGIDKLINILSLIMTIANTVLKVTPIVLIILYLVKNRKEKRKLKLNKATTIYILITFGVLWWLIRAVDQVMVISNFLYVEALVSIGLMVASILVSDGLKAVTEKTKPVATAIKQKTIERAYRVKQKSVIVTDKVKIRTSEMVPVVHKTTENIKANVLQMSLDMADLIKQKSSEVTDKVKEKTSETVPEVKRKAEYMKLSTMLKTIETTDKIKSKSSIITDKVKEKTSETVPVVKRMK